MFDMLYSNRLILLTGIDHDHLLLLLLLW